MKIPTYLLFFATLYAQGPQTTPPGASAPAFYENGTYREDIRTPGEFLGLTLGEQPVRYAEIRAYFQYLADTLSNAVLHSYGSTHEGRELIYLVLSSEENMYRLKKVRSQIARLADPRKLQPDDRPERIIARTPAIAWMAYSIHGDELSSSDAALQLAYQLLAGTDSTSARIREEVVVCIDPLQNPDGRERILGQLEQWKGTVANPDVQSLNHSGVWPWGRGNHYLFDLNRDWFATVQPETRGKVRAILNWNPQLVVDCHEMGSYDTYLFTPPRAPFNPFLPRATRNWWQKFAGDQAAAFDRHGWSYYTREWNEEMYPGYGSSWGIYTGLIGILYEQAGTEGSLVKQPDETLLTFHEAVHHQFTSSLANLQTLARNRQAILNDYYHQRQGAVDPSNASRAFILPPSENSGRRDRYVETLTRQSIEIFQLEKGLSVMVTDPAGSKKRSSLPAGTVVIPLNQPLKPLIENILSFDIRIDTKSLEKERREVLKNNRGTLYDVTAWSLPLAHGMEAFYTTTLPRNVLIPYQPPKRQVTLLTARPRFGFLINGRDDRVYLALARLLEKGYQVWCARKDFTVEGRTYPAGSLLIKIKSNPTLDLNFLNQVARDTGLDIIGVDTGLSSQGPDLGGNDFVLLEDPHIALLGGVPASTYSFGSIWHLLDQRLKTRISLLNLTAISRQDLRKYNLLVLPAVYGGVQAYRQVLGPAGIAKLKAWVEDGGTLIAEGVAAATLADTAVALTAVRQRRQVLADLGNYRRALKRLRDAEQPRIDSLALWEGQAGEEAKAAPSEPAPAVEEIEAADEQGRKLKPQGAILRVDLDPEHWLAFGCGESVPVLYNSSYALLARKPVQVPARLARGKQLRLSGLLWPEARDRLAEAAWATRESLGRGQIILFASLPTFRGYFHGSERLLLNALYLGPGMGTQRSVDW